MPSMARLWQLQRQLPQALQRARVAFHNVPRPAAWALPPSEPARLGAPSGHQLALLADQPRRYVAAASADPSTQASTSAPAPPPAPKPKVFNVRPITKDDVEISFARSGGAGGQNVNKVNTKVDMRFELDSAAWIPDEVKEAIRQKEKNRITFEGVLVMQSQRHRTQAQNLDDALAKLQDIIDAAVDAVTVKEADPETVKRVKAQIKAGKEKRLDSKKKDSMRKKERSRKDWD